VLTSKLRSWTALLFGTLAVGTVAWAASFPLTESKEELDLEYEVSAVARDGTVLVKLTITELGRLKPLDGVVLAIPSERGNTFDIRVPLATTLKDGKLTTGAQLSRALAERATIELVPENPPQGLPDDPSVFTPNPASVLGSVFYPIPLREHIKPWK
jgi:hypothetical protein